MTVPVAVVGAGSMGSSHARVLSKLAGAELRLVVDSDAARARAVAERFGCSWSDDPDETARHAGAAVLAVPTARHAETAVRLLDQGVDLLVEKPLASSVAEGEAIVRRAAELGRVLAVGHVERFNPVCLELAQVVRDPLFISTRRTSPFSGRIEEGVVTDLMVHDVDIVLALAGRAAPVRLSAEAAAVRSATDDLAVATIVFDSGLIAQLTVSRISQEKIRRIEVVERDCSVTADLLHQNVEIRRRTSVEFVDEGGTRLRETTTMETPYLDRRGEPLVLELEDFVEAVRARGAPLVDGAAGLRALEVCEQLVAARGAGARSAADV